MPTAAEVVKAYQERKRESNKDQLGRDLIAAATLDVLAAFSGTFTAKDVRACVAEMLEDDQEVGSWSTNKRGRIVTKTIDEQVAKGDLPAPDAEGIYQQRGRAVPS